MSETVVFVAIAGLAALGGACAWFGLWLWAAVWWTLMTAFVVAAQHTRWDR